MFNIQQLAGTSLYDALKNDYAQLRPDLVASPTDDSDDEGAETASSYPSMAPSQPPSSSDMTIESRYCGKRIRFKGNQLVLWARNMMERVIVVHDRDAKIATALRERAVALSSPGDWLTYEGMFDGFHPLLAKSSPPFSGIATIFMNSMASTTVEFKNKTFGSGYKVLYANLHDRELIDFLKARFPKYNYSSNYGLSYKDINDVVERLKAEFQLNDADLAKRQITLFKGSAKGEVGPIDRFLSYFNAILFGSETSRNSLSFVTGILVLDMIAKEQLSYRQCFLPPDWSSFNRRADVPFAVYPMASPYAGAKNFRAYRSMLDRSKQEEATHQLSSSIGMKTSREHFIWTQIQCKEAILLKFWAKDLGDQPGWLNVKSTDASEEGRAVEFARRFNQRVVSLLHEYYPHQVSRLLVYSREEMRALGGWPLPVRVWKNPDDPDCTRLEYDALEWHITTAQPLRLEKDIEDANAELQAAYFEALEESDPL